MISEESTATIKGKVANLSRLRPFNDPELNEYRRELLARRVLKQVAENVPALTDEQRARIIAAMNGAPVAA